MKRFVLALLALLGLVAQSAPLQARICGVNGAEIGAVVVDRARAQALVSQAVPSEAPTAKPEHRERDCAIPSVDRKRPVYIPTVQLGSDRTRE